MNTKNTGGCAFPSLDNPESNISVREDGMTLRDYFAAKAPQEIPDWFVCPTIPEPPVPDTTGLSATERSHFNGLRNGSLSEERALSAAVLLWHTYKETQLARDNWRQHNEIARYFAWRWNYADAMLAEREKA